MAKVTTIFMSIEWLHAISVYEHTTLKGGLDLGVLYTFSHEEGILPVPRWALWIWTMTASQQDTSEFQVLGVKGEGWVTTSYIPALILFSPIVSFLSQTLVLLIVRPQYALVNPNLWSSMGVQAKKTSPLSMEQLWSLHPQDMAKEMKVWRL